MKVVAKNFLTQHVVLCDSLLDEGMLLTGAEPPVNAEGMQDTIEKCLDRYLHGEDFSAISRKPYDALAVFWGWTVTLSFKWEWKAFDLIEEGEPDFHDIGICDPERRYFYLPRNLFRLLIEGRRTIGAKQRFDAIKNGKLPPAAPVSLIDLSRE